MCEVESGKGREREVLAKVLGVEDEKGKINRGGGVKGSRDEY